MSLTPRPYQQEAINALWGFWKNNPSGTPLIVMPTGAGKAPTISFIIEKISEKYPSYRFLIATHTKEIVIQNARELQRLLPNESLGIYSAGLNSKTIRRITFANIQSVYKAAKNLEVGMLIIDECHLISRNENSMYQKLIANLRDNNRDLRIVGFTATPMRMDQGSMVAEGSTFTDICYDISIRELIDAGYLSPLVSVAKQAVDLTGVKTSGYDYNQGDLERAFSPLVEHHCREIIKHAKDRKHWLIFCSGIKHAEETAECLKGMGVPADYLTGEMIGYERDIKLRKFVEGETRALVNVGVLTTGFNFKPIDCIGLLLSTKSASRYIQSVGRGTRTAEGKTDCLVLDFGGNIERHGPIDLIQVKSKKGKKAEIGVAPYKLCPMCGCASHTKVRICPACEYEYPESSCLVRKVSTASVMSKVEEMHVDSRAIKIHNKDGKPPSLRIEYRSGMRTLSDFLCFDHGGFATSQARKKWFQRGGQFPLPTSTDEAFVRQGELKPVKLVRAIRKGEYYEILSVEFSELSEKQIQEKWEAEHPF